MNAPTIINLPSETVRQASRVQWWRRNEMQMSVTELARHTGYQAAAIYRLERGYNSKGKPFGANAWKRYLQACQNLAHKRGRRGPCELPFS